MKLGNFWLHRIVINMNHWWGYSGLLPVTCQVPPIANITLVILWGHPAYCTPHWASISPIPDSMCDMVSLGCNWDNLSKVKVTFSLLLCRSCYMRNTVSYACVHNDRSVARHKILAWLSHNSLCEGDFALSASLRLATNLVASWTTRTKHRGGRGVCMANCATVYARTL